MGGYTSKQERNSKRFIKRNSTEKTARLIREERDEQEKVILDLKVAETEWRKERKSLREVVKKLRLKMKENEEAKTQHHEWDWVVEQMCLEKAVRDEAVERWKQLYFAIKNELDDLIHRTYGETLHQKLQEESVNTVQELKQELKVKEETIETLKERIALMEKQRYVKEREIDLLRQSMRILGNGGTKNKAPSPATRNLPIFKTKFVGCK